MAEKEEEMSKSPLITVDSRSLFPRFSIFYTLFSISTSLYPCGIGPSPNRSDDTFEMQNGFQVNQPGLFSRLSATDNSFHYAP